ncbi:hypothetical protein P152DRAFT_278803 [Eremomyces bilateralis CBS 781.70]|uniref:MHYT domain-containing protein n=1 Tax=Eremomyces bilateralis CBS 781.70 TaxID=1392243 RepID=A0A6G1G9H4_9PEZI|nr:uncharacterized protein P152DRAFT_278803 [Eremomyces bilateralis CBS 781.70]KAF1814551.1 hypothetical protein P152DRAFT_278803 [Eremomyces bilateralis CBS 781.70]
MSDGVVYHGYEPGQVVSVKYTPGIIVASWFVSLVGAVTTVELLHRRKSRKGWGSWLQLGAISVSFGLVAIWCMHFVGNRAIVLGDGNIDIQLHYNPGFSALSAFLPILFLFLGFKTVELRQPGERLFWPCLVIAGFVAGLSIMGMHYIGNFGINNYTLRNPPHFIIAADLIACFSCILALSLFFYFRERWINSISRRLLCACILACAVSGMHWVATIGTTYRFSQVQEMEKIDRNIHLIIALVMSFLAICACVGVTVVQHIRKMEIADRAQHVLLASATFDPDGRLLVTQDGLLPCRKVTKSYNQQSFDDDFNTAHPVFQWLFRVTHNWSSVTELVPAMRSHLKRESVKETSIDKSRVPQSGWGELEGTDEYSLIFREYFCVAASDLAASMDAPLPNIGALYHKILMTGTVSPEFRLKTPRNPDVESGRSTPNMFGRGQLLFLVRSVDRGGANRLIGNGYRFAMPNQVGDIIGKSMQIPTPELISTVLSLRQYARNKLEAPQGGTFLASFTLRAPLKGNWEVLVSSQGPDVGQLPKVRLSSTPLESWQLNFLGEMEGCSLNQCVRYLTKLSDSSNAVEAEFADVVVDAIRELTEMVPEPFFGQSIFSSKPVNLNSARGSPNQAPTSLLPFCIIPDVHHALIKSADRVTYVPLSFFRCSQRVYNNSPDHAHLEQKIHREFAGILSTKDLISASDSLPSSSVKSSTHKIRKKWQFSEGTTPRNSIGVNLESSSENDLVGSDNRQGSMDMSAYPFGGIMVSSDVVMEMADTKGDNHIELQDLGITSQAGTADAEQATYVDELFRLTSMRWQRS